MSKPPSDPANTTTDTPAWFQPARRVCATGVSIFATMSALAVKHGAANLGQGFPDEDGPQEMLDLAATLVNGRDRSGAMRPGTTRNQYGPGQGLPELREAIAADRARRYGHRVDPETEVLVTVGATEALAATVLGVIEQGRDLVVLEPTYDAYPALADLAGANLVRVGLTRRGAGWALDREALRAALSSNTAALLINSPHNPTGAVLDREDLEFIASLVRGTSTVVITDEVYERLVFSGEHVPLATLPGMAERTVTISSAAKTFNVTGWKIGWALAPKELLAPINAAKQYLSFCGATPFQPAVAWALGHAGEWSDGWVQTLRERKEQLSDALAGLGLEVLDVEGTYFLLTDIAPAFPGESAEEFCARLPEQAGVVGIPVSAFVESGSPISPGCRTLVRWTFCKNEETLATACERLRAFGERER